MKRKRYPTYLLGQHYCPEPEPAELFDEDWDGEIDIAHLLDGAEGRALNAALTERRYQ